MRKNFTAVLVVLSATMMLTSCGGGDNSGENLIFAILLILACLKKAA